MKTAPTTPTRHPFAFFTTMIGSVGKLFKRNRKPPKTLILGGIKSGKSHRADQWAEELLSRHQTVLRITAASAESDAMPASDLPALLRKTTEPILIDCLGVWLNRLLVEVGAWQDREGWQALLNDCLEDLVQAWAEVTVPVIAVSNETGSGMTPPTEAGRLFRDVLGALNLRISLSCDQVFFMVAGRALTLS
jgi:adenosylcobinamide kinase/adenosylcobinamide-phosphate guanylyltransferase